MSDVTITPGGHTHAQGQGDFRYELVEGWEQLPEGWSHGDVAGVASDSQDRVYVFNRSEHPVIVYNRDGTFITSWGEGVFTRPHGITIEDDIVYLADDSDHTVRKFSLEGDLLMALGNLNQPSETGYSPEGPANLKSIARAAGPFNRPTRLSVAPSGDLYVSDGYGNARIHIFGTDGKLKSSFGGPGRGPGQFMLPHSVWVHTDGRVFVADRENDRIQIFDAQGNLLDAWTNVTRPGDLYIDAQNNVYIGEMYWVPGMQSIAGQVWQEDRPSRLTVRTLSGEIISKFGGEIGSDPCAARNFTSPHGIWVDNHGDVYVGEVSKTSYQGTIFKPGCHSLQKFARVR
jgi:DNA-binding beta-propeller fold protein YncE